MKHRLLIIDDDRLVLRALSRSLTRWYDVDVVQTCEGALWLVQNGEKYGAILVDHYLPSPMRWDQMQTQLDRHHAGRLIVMSGSPDNEFHDLLRRVEGRFMPKPSSSSEMVALIDRCIASE